MRREWPRVATNRKTRIGLAPDHHARPAEVDLHLPAGRRLEAHRRAGLGGQLTPEMRDRPLDGAQADCDAVLGQESCRAAIRLGLARQSG